MQTTAPDPASPDPAALEIATLAVEAALGAGALGARMTGGGFGGSAIALLPPGLEAAVKDAVLDAYSAQGWEPPGFLDGTAGGPAAVERLT